jgi:hypothetical protein
MFSHTGETVGTDMSMNESHGCRPRPQCNPWAAGPVPAPRDSFSVLRLIQHIEPIYPLRSQNQTRPPRPVKLSEPFRVLLDHNPSSLLPSGRVDLGRQLTLNPERQQGWMGRDRSTRPPCEGRNTSRHIYIRFKKNLSFLWEWKKEHTWKSNAPWTRG